MATVTTAALAELSGLAGNTGSKTAFTYLAVGTGTTAESAAHTQLVTEVTGSGLARASATVTQATTTHTNDTLQLVKAWTVSGTVTISEVMMGNNATANTGTMAFRELLSPTKSVVSGDTYSLTAKLVFVDA